MPQTLILPEDCPKIENNHNISKFANCREFYFLIHSKSSLVDINIFFKYEIQIHTDFIMM